MLAYVTGTVDRAGAQVHDHLGGIHSSTDTRDTSIHPGADILRHVDYRGNNRKAVGA